MKAKLSKTARKEEWMFYLFITPWIVGMLCFTIVPMVTSLYYSFTKITVLGLAHRKPEWIAFQNYINIFTQDTLFLQSIGTTFLFAFLRVFSGILISLLLALLYSKNICGKKLLIVLIYLPALMPIAGSALLWRQMFSNDFSILNYLLGFIGIPPVKWLAYPNAIYSIVLMSVWSGLGPTMIIFVAALANVPKDLMEAADLDGAGFFSKFRAITLPMISSSMMYLLVTGFIGALQAYAEMELLTGGGPGTSTMTMEVMNNAFKNRGMGYASALAWVIFCIILVFTAVFFKFTSAGVYYEAE